MFCGFLRQSTAVTIKLGPFVDSTDGNTEEVGLTILQAAVRLSKNGGNYAQKNESSTATHDELGDYDCAIDTTDTDTLGRLRVAVHVSGALMVVQTYQVIPAAIYDALIAGTEWLHVDTLKVEHSISGTTLTVRKPDDTTTDYTKTLTTDAGADPVTGVS